MNIIKKIIENSKLEEECLFEMANVRKSTTGLPVNIWASPAVGRKGLRIKISNDYGNTVDPDETFSMYFDGDNLEIDGDTGKIRSSDLKIIKDYFTKHRAIFQLFWDKKIDDDELKRLLAKASKN